MCLRCDSLDRTALATVRRGECRHRAFDVWLPSDLSVLTFQVWQESIKGQRSVGGGIGFWTIVTTYHRDELMGPQRAVYCLTTSPSESKYV